MATLTAEIIEAAIGGFEAQKQKIDEQIAQLRAMLPGSSAGSKPAPKGRKRGMSAAGRRAIADAQKRRWAEAKGASPAPAKRAKKGKRRLSAEGRANIIAALKKRWAAKKKAANA